LTEGSTVSGDSREQFVKQQYPPGTATVCYVDPANPAEAVLSRRISPTITFGIWPLALTLLVAAALVTAGHEDRANAFFAQSKWTLCVVGLVAVALTAWGAFAPP